MRFSLFKGFQDLFQHQGPRGRGRGRRRHAGFQRCPILETRPASHPTPTAAPQARSASVPGRLARVDATRCKGCKKCAAVCRSAAITFTPIAQIDPANCTGCGKCLAQCPSQAISLIPI